MKKVIGILVIFTIKTVVADETIKKIEPTFYSNTTIYTTQDDENPDSFHSRHARDISCKVCGRINNELRSGMMIGGGLRVTPCNKYPWMVYVIKEMMNRVNTICGGVLLSEDFILTAAHCCLEKVGANKLIHPRSVKIYFTTRLGRKVAKGPPVEITYPHPEYTGSWAHDICLIKMKFKIRCDEYRSPICIPNENLKVYPGKNILVAGWGIKEVEMAAFKKIARELHEAEMQIAPMEYCKGRNPLYKKPYLMCIIPHQKQFTCHGDSGVPIFIKYQHRYFVVGIYSGRIGKTCSDTPKIANSVPKHLEWITSVTGIIPDYPKTRAGEKFVSKQEKDAQREGQDFFISR